MITVRDFDAFERIAEYVEHVPFDVTPQRLYNADMLYASVKLPDGTTTNYDAAVYQHFIKTGKHACDEQELLARALHDYGIERALQLYLERYDKRKVVGVMGGHSLQRTDEMYRTIALVSKELTERHSLMVSGGGPGAMEATHFGAWMAGREMDEFETALQMLHRAPSFNDSEWLSTAFAVMKRFPQNVYRSLGIPTYLYGHEPSTPFATDIAKYFDNSVREDTIITIAFGGIIFTPGSAGTMQEIFQEAVQNHYLTFGVSSPMIFLGRAFWDEQMPVYPFLEQLVETGKYKNLKLFLTDEPYEAVQELLSFRNETEPIHLD